MEHETRITAGYVFGEVDKDGEIEKSEARKLRRTRARLFREEVESIVKEFPSEDSRKGKKKSLPLYTSIDGSLFEVRATKQTSPFENFGRIHYISVSYQLVVKDFTTNESRSLFTFEDILYPDRDNPKHFEHGDTKIFNQNGKMASHHEALEGLWGVRMLREQLESQSEMQ